MLLGSVWRIVSVGRGGSKVRLVNGLRLANRGKQVREHGMITSPVSCVKNEESGAKFGKKRGLGWL